MKREILGEEKKSAFELTGFPNGELSVEEEERKLIIRWMERI